MKKDLFDDLISLDIVDRYNKQNEDFDLQQQQDELSEQIVNVAKGTMNVDWAKKVIEFYSQVSNNKLLQTNPNKSILENIYDMAVKIIDEENHRKLDEKAKEKQQQEKEKQDHILDCQEQAKSLDERILKLSTQKENNFWCNSVESLCEQIKETSREITKFLTYKELLKEMLAKTVYVKKAFEYDTNIGLLEHVEQDGSWAMKIVKIEREIEKNRSKEKILPYMTNLDKLKLYVEMARVIIFNDGQAKLKREAEEKEQKEKEKQERLEKEEQERQLRIQERNEKEQEELAKRLEKQKHERDLKILKLELMGYLNKFKKPPFVVKEQKDGLLSLEKWNDTSVKDFIVPAGIESIVSSAFNDCKKIKRIEFPQTLKNIAGYTFYDKPSIKEVHLNEGIERIGERAFAYCKNLKSIYLPSSLKTICEGVFSGCKKLKEIVVSENNPYFCSIDGHLYSKDLKNLYHYCLARKEKSYTLPSETLRVKQHAFIRANNLKYVNLNNVCEVEGEVFSNCKNLKRVDMRNVKKRGNRISWRCKKLKEINEK